MKKKKSSSENYQSLRTIVFARERKILSLFDNLNTYMYVEKKKIGIKLMKRFTHRLRME